MSFHSKKLLYKNGHLPQPWEASPEQEAAHRIALRREKKLNQKEKTPDRQVLS
jgi:hypothetical protein